MTSHLSRRTLLRTLGAGAAVGVAGCGSRGSSDPPGTTTGRKNPTETATPTATPSPTPTPEAKRSFADHPDVSVVDDFEDLSEWRGEVGSVEAAPGRSVAGSQSLRITAPGSRALVRGPLSADLTDRKLSVAADVVQPGRFVVVVLRLYAPDESNVVELGELIRPSKDQGWVRLDLGTRRMAGFPDLSSVTAVEIELLTNADGPMDVHVDGLYSAPAMDQGYVAVTFDDSLASHHSEAYRVLSEHGIAGSVATITGSVGSDGHLSLDQMDEMKADGWEFASHTVNHTSLLGMNADRLREEVVGAQNWLRDHGFEAGANHLVYPHGAFDRRTYRFASRHHDAAYAYVGAEGAGTGRIFDPHTVSRGNAADVAMATKMVDRGVAYNELVAFTFHRIGDGGSLSVSVEDFERFAAHVAESDATVVTLSQLPSPPFALE